jgi:hypothetical protein
MDQPLPYLLTTLCLLTLASPVISQTQGATIWPQLSRENADCEIPGVSTSLGKANNPFEWIRRIDTCIVNSSLIRTANGARGQFLTVTDFKEGGVGGHGSYLYEVDCEKLQSRMRHYWNLSKNKYRAISGMHFDEESKWWYLFRDDAWGEWKPVESIGKQDQFLCLIRPDLPRY